MAVKMMSISAVDRQFIDDNMLTDEDFRFDAEDEFEVSIEDKNFLESLANELQSMNSEMFPSSIIQSVDQTTNACSDLNDLLKDYIYDVKFKVEPPSPNSSDISSEVHSTDNEVSVITIPEVSSDCETTVITDTPPHTPCGIMDSLPESPSSCSVEPVIVSVSSASGITYALPQNTQDMVNPVKYRVNIQPKLEKVTKPVPIQAIIPKSGNKAVLTSEQMEKFAKGTLQIRSPPNMAISVPKTLQNNKATPNSILSKTSLKSGPGRKTSTLNSLEICAAAIKRQERIIKNRESAYLSRKRKKEYVQKLEAELNQMTAENSSLREENCRLKLKVSDLEKEILKLRTAFSSKNMKKTVCFMVVLFMLTFNLAPFSSIFEKGHPVPVKSDFSNHRKGRVLLWDDSKTIEEKNESKSLYHKLSHVPKEVQATYIVDFDKSYNSSSCQHFINKTESLRLESDLLGWVERVEKKRVQTKLKKQKFPRMFNTLPNIASWSKRKAEHSRDIWARRKNNHEILIYETPRQAYEDFFEAIHRRDDTFYFVSFSGDHLLLPAIAHNKTLRPRMSFVMPAMTLNESVNESDDHISMMQIDCEVMDTKLVYIKESVIPEHLRQKPSNATKTNSKHSADHQPSRRLQSVNKLPHK